MPRPLKMPGAHLPEVFSLRTAEDARRLHQILGEISDAVVIGGGFIGLEIAATLAGLGKNVTVVEIADRLLGRAVSPLISTHVLQRLRAYGARVLLGTAAERIEEEHGRVAAVRISSGERIGADIVIAGIGVTPDCGLAAGAGLRLDDGILVDPSMRTSDPDILAVGDCVRFHHWQADRLVRLESVQNATDQSKLAARTILGRREQYRAVPWFWSDQGDMKLQMVGLSFGADRYVLRGSSEENAFSVYHFAGSRLVAIDSVNRPADHMLGRKMMAAGFLPSPEEVETGEAAEAFARFQNLAEDPASNAGRAIRGMKI